MGVAVRESGWFTAGGGLIGLNREGRSGNMEIAKGIHQVGGSGYTADEDAAIYLLSFDGQAALVDAGCGYAFQLLKDNIRAAGVDPGLITDLLLTHCHFDHCGGAAQIRSAFGCRVAAHALDAPYLESGDNQVTAADWYGASIEPVIVDRVLQMAEETIFLGAIPIRAFHCPGHSPGSVVYLVESEGLKVLFGQDVHGPLHPSLKSNREDYYRSLEKMRDLEADILCEGHFGIYRGRDKVERFIRSFMP